MFPLLDHRVTLLMEKLGSLQGEPVGILPSHGLPLGVQSCDHFALFGLPLHPPLTLFGVALLATMPKTTVELEDSFRLRVITVHPRAKNMALAPMPAPGVMDVDAPPLCLPLEPFDCHETAT